LVLVFYAFVQVYGSSVFICNGGKVEKDNGWVTYSHWGKSSWQHAWFHTTIWYHHHGIFFSLMRSQKTHKQIMSL